MFGEILQKFAEKSPATVMVRALLEQLLNPERLDRWFETTRQAQYTRDILNSGDSLLISSGCGHHLADPGEDTNSGGIIDPPSTKKPKRFPHRRVVGTTRNRTHVLVGDDRAFQWAADATLVIFSATAGRDFTVKVHSQAILA